MNKPSSILSSCLPETLWEIEKRLSQPTFRGVPVGSALASLLYLELYCRNGDWSIKGALKNRMRFFYHHLYIRKGGETDVSFCKGRVLVTGIEPNFRCRDLVFPVAERLGYDRCVLLYIEPEMTGLLPQGAMGLDVEQSACYDIWSWRRDYLRFWIAFKPVVKQTVRELDLPWGVYYRLADAVVSCTQRIAGFLEFLRRSQVAAVLTEYDRNWMWAPLVLSAKALGIPTYTLMHGVTSEKCLGFYPLLADTIFCWGEMFANIFVAAGVDPSRIEVAGCPRLTRDLPMPPDKARAKMGLDPNKPVVMLATSNYHWDNRLKLAETFCQAVHGSPAFTGVVRLHPMDKLQGYAELAARFPSVMFMSNEEFSLDVALAASDIIVVHSSGFGSDALAKRRLTVVLDTIDQSLEHSLELIKLAGSPRATSSESLSDIVHQLLFNEQERCKHRQLAEEYVRKFCAFFGDEAARRIANHVLSKIDNISK